MQARVRRGDILIGMSMRDIKGKKIGKDGMWPEAADSKGDVVFPTFYISIDHLPEAKEWPMGETYDVTLRLRMTGLNIRKHEGKDKDLGDANFEIVGIDPVGKVKADKKAKRYTEAEEGQT